MQASTKFSSLCTRILSPCWALAGESSANPCIIRAMRHPLIFLIFVCGVGTGSDCSKKTQYIPYTYIYTYLYIYIFINAGVDIYIYIYTSVDLSITSTEQAGRFNSKTFPQFIISESSSQICCHCFVASRPGSSWQVLSLAPVASQARPARPFKGTSQAIHWAMQGGQPGQSRAWQGLAGLSRGAARSVKGDQPSQATQGGPAHGTQGYQPGHSRGPAQPGKGLAGPVRVVEGTSHASQGPGRAWPEVSRAWQGLA
jgi:hypothetical protein